MLGLASCATAVRVEPPQDPPALCADLSQAWPKRVAGQEQRRTEPPSPATAAWGDPPIVVTCGASGAAIPADAELLSVDGITWYPEELSAGVRFTSVDLPMTLVVTVPHAYAPEVNPLLDLSATITARTPPVPKPS